jgi:hypothetical protein
MKATFEYPEGVTPEDIVKYLHDNGISGTWWSEDILNMFTMNGIYSDEKWDLLYSIVKDGFFIHGHQVRSHMVMKRRPRK